MTEVSKPNKKPPSAAVTVDSKHQKMLCQEYRQSDVLASITILHVNGGLESKASPSSLLDAIPPAMVESLKRSQVSSWLISSYYTANNDGRAGHTWN
jgi:hypothetical protein